MFTVYGGAYWFSGTGPLIHSCTLHWLYIQLADWITQIRSRRVLFVYDSSNLNSDKVHDHKVDRKTRKTLFQAHLITSSNKHILNTRIHYMSWKCVPEIIWRQNICHKHGNKPIGFNHSLVVFSHTSVMTNSCNSLVVNLRGMAVLSPKRLFPITVFKCGVFWPLINCINIFCSAESYVKLNWIIFLVFKHFL